MDNKCKYCNKIFSSINALKKHEKTANYCLKLRGKKSDIKCKYCLKKFGSEKIFQHWSSSGYA